MRPKDITLLFINQLIQLTCEINGHKSRFLELSSVFQKTLSTFFLVKQKEEFWQLFQIHHIKESNHAYIRCAKQNLGNFINDGNMITYCHIVNIDYHCKFEKILQS